MTLNTLLNNEAHLIKSSGRIKEQTKVETERLWRDSELTRTDKLVILPDYPTDLISYRTSLRDYPQTEDFPNGERPVMYK